MEADITMSVSRIGWPGYSPRPFSIIFRINVRIIVIQIKSVINDLLSRPLHIVVALGLG